jgi:hypothetical protein
LILKFDTAQLKTPVTVQLNPNERRENSTG